MCKMIDSYQEFGEIKINTEDELRLSLMSVLEHGTRIVILDFGKDGYLTVGIGKPYGFVQYTKSDNSAPYLVAKNPEMEASHSFVEFDSGGTITPISLNYCIDFSLVIELATFFFKNREIPQNISWQDIFL